MACARSFTRRSTSSSEATPRRSSCSSRGAERLHVAVGVDQARDGEEIRPIDHAGERPAEAIDFGHGADGGDRAVAHGQGLGPGVGGIAGPDAFDLDDQRGLAVALQAQCAAGKLAFRVRVHLEVSAVRSATAVDEEMLHAGSEPGRLVERRRIAKRCRVEHDEVGDRTRAEDAPIGKAEDLGGQARCTNGSPASSVMIFSSRA